MMKKLYFISIMLILCIAIFSCDFNSSFSEFEGNVSSSEDSFFMNYEIFNQQKSGFLNLSQGDSISVLISNSKGAVDVKVGLDEEKSIYEGKNLTNIKFTLNISESGIYKIDVIGHKACGNVKFEKLKTSVRSEIKKSENQNSF